MADGFKGNASDAISEISQAVVKPVVQEAGQMIEVAAQSLSGQQTNPQDQKKKQEEVQKKLKDQQKAQRIRKWLNDYSEAERKLKLERSLEQQKKMQTMQEDHQEKQVENAKEFKKRSQLDEHIQRQKAKAELKGGVGG